MILEFSDFSALCSGISETMPAGALNTGLGAGSATFGCSICFACVAAVDGNFDDTQISITPGKHAAKIPKIPVKALVITAAVLPKLIPGTGTGAEPVREFTFISTFGPSTFWLRRDFPNVKSACHSAGHPTNCVRPLSASPWQIKSCDSRVLQSCAAFATPGRDQSSGHSPPSAP